MSKASILNQLKDEDLEAIRHMIRRDAMTDLQIAIKAGIGVSASGSKGVSDAAAAMIIARYRKSKLYRDWLKRWENQDVELKRQIETQKQRFEFLSNLVQTAQGDGLKTVSQSLLARLLTMASELSDEELKSAAAGKQGWVVKVINAVTDDLKREQSASIDKAADVAANGIKIKPEDLVKKVDEVMGISAKGGSARGGKNV